MNSIINDIKYNDSGLVPTIVQDYNSGDILMFAFSNEEAIRKSITTNIAHFWSRSRKELWEKGSTSGNRLNIVNIYIDCDKDCLLYTVNPDGPACHTNTKSCFNTDIDNKEREVPLLETQIINEVFKIIEDRKENVDNGKSYTQSLFKDGLKKILSKVKEESDESIEASENGERDKIIYEYTDLLYHMMVAISYHNIDISEIFKELERRIGKTKKDYTLDE